MALEVAANDRKVNDKAGIPDPHGLIGSNAQDATEGKGIPLRHDGPYRPNIAARKNGSDLRWRVQRRIAPMRRAPDCIADRAGCKVHARPFPAADMSDKPLIPRFFADPTKPNVKGSNHICRQA
jgi:hypothetical protein